jgi:hypothetical protein
MYVDHDNIIDHMRNESFVLKAYSTIEFTSKWMCAVYEDIEYHIRNESFL